MEKSTVEELLDTAVRSLYEKDSYLFEVGAHERSITHRLGLYLQELFANWDVDCEYNRDGHDPKRIPLNEANYSDPGQTVYPDIIIHKRGRNGPNLLVIEAKTAPNSDSKRDKDKLQGYKKELKYTYGFF